MQRITFEELDVFFDQQLLHRSIRRKHGLLFFQPAVAGPAVDGLVLTTVGYLAEKDGLYEPASAREVQGV